VFLLSHRIRFGQPSTKFVVDVLQRLETKGVEVIARRKRLDAAEPGTLQATREHDVAIEPRSTRRHLRKRHADVKGDAGLLRQHLDRPDVLNRRDDRVEQRANQRRLSREMMVQIMTATGMRLIAIRERATAPLASPQRRLTQR